MLRQQLEAREIDLRFALNENQIWFERIADIVDLLDGDVLEVERYHVEVDIFVFWGDDAAMGIFLHDFFIVDLLCFRVPVFVSFSLSIIISGGVCISFEMFGQYELFWSCGD